MARPDRYWLVLAAALLVTGSAGQVVLIWFFKDLVDGVLVPRQFSHFWPVAAAMAGTAAASAVATFLGDYTAARVAERFMLRLRTATVEHLHTLPPDTHRKRWHGDVVARLTADIYRIEELVATGVVKVGSALVSLVFFAGAAVYLSWQLAVAAFVISPLFFFAARSFSRRIQIRSREARRRNGGVTAVVEESLANSALAHAYNQQEREIARVRREGQALLRADLATARVAYAYPAVLDVLEVVAGLTVVGLGVLELSRGALTIGGLLAFAAFLTELFGPVQQLSRLASVFGAATAGAERVIELLGTSPPARERPDAIDLRPVHGLLSCENVEAIYPGEGAVAVLRDVNFSVAPGEILAVMGPSGAGKSTLAKLLVRFMDPAAGTIRLDGVDLRDCTLASVRDAVTLLPQQAQLFHATIRDNILYGRPGATEEEMVEAAHNADAHGFITALPRGYDSVIGEDGFQLSGGQAQRIAIARAFLRGTPVLVLDEPTAGLDAEAAAHILEPLRRLMTGRTTVLFTHDHRLAGGADVIHTLPRTASGGQQRQRVSSGAS
ncbi:ABC transporter ATP-binding protein/permease [Streptomyces sp. RB6PN25]|uniref:ABC transporter ATP-binding protein/permease n=1 Tax=Streptomyces humicola TaxID=2953240 RepID=A0ABT1PUE8_9ACTN|nr:ABC transporter ATP-binding protein [Streptomyces humicola]MCQ4081298.1 ABC transporter ATP-binding protein/permease [Streptomyces humicola]